MGSINITDLKITPQKQLKNELGSIFHALKSEEEDFNGFGEAYFSSVNHGQIKSWRRHNCSIANIVVPVGEIRFVFYDDRVDSATCGNFGEIKLSPHNYLRITVPQKIWMAFQGCSHEQNLLLNIASLPHDPLESDQLSLEEIPYNW